MGNLDNMMQSYEEIQKVEHNVEATLKKIIKAYKDIKPGEDIKKLQVDSKTYGPTDIHKFLTKFEWDESKYPRNKPLAHLIKIMTSRINTVDANLRKKVMDYASSRDKAAQASKKDT